MNEDQIVLLCACCSKELAAGRGEFYVVRIEAMADPTPPIFTEDDFSDDITEEIEELFEGMEELTEQEANDQVYRRLVLHLCTLCYKRWIEDPTGC